MVWLRLVVALTTCVNPVAAGRHDLALALVVSAAQLATAHKQHGMGLYSDADMVQLQCWKGMTGAWQEVDEAGRGVAACRQSSAGQG